MLVYNNIVLDQISKKVLLLKKASEAYITKLEDSDEPKYQQLASGEFLVEVIQESLLPIMYSINDVDVFMIATETSASSCQRT